MDLSKIARMVSWDISGNLKLLKKVYGLGDEVIQKYCRRSFILILILHSHAGCQI